MMDARTSLNDFMQVAWEKESYLSRDGMDQMISFTMNQFHHWMSFIMGKYWMLSEKISNQIAALNNILHNELSCC